MAHPLGKFAHLSRDPNPQGATSAAREFWRAHGGVAFTADQIRAMGGMDRQLLEAMAAKHYGKRSNGKS